MTLDVTKVNTISIAGLVPGELDKKISQATAGLYPSYKKHLNNIAAINATNAGIICDYIDALTVEVRPSVQYRRDIVNLLTVLAKRVGPVNFKDLTRQDIISFLKTFEKTEEADPLHKWVGTYNIFREHLSRFFKWLYYPDLDYQLRKQAVKPAVITNIPQLKRKEISNYEPTDLWTTEEELLFLKYCPSKRDKCYHAVSRDTSARPIEILRLKRRDVKFKEIGTSQYAEVTLKGRKGKEGQRTVPLIDSLPYLKDYLLNEHPMPSNPDAPLISSTGKSLGRHLRTKRIWDIYDNHKKKTFPGLLQSPDVSPEDKQKIVELLKKPWNPYIRRHTALTAKSKILRDNVFKQHAGWTKNSQMQIKYLHYFGNESSESLLEAYGLVDHGVQLDQLRPKQCPNCNESCKVDDKFCPKCMMVLSYDSYNEVIDKQRQFESDMKEVHDILSEIKDLKKKLKKD